MSHSMTDPTGERCPHGIRWSTGCPQCDGEMQARITARLDAPEPCSQPLAYVPLIAGRPHWPGTQPTRDSDDEWMALYAAPPAALLEAAHETLHWLEGQQADEEADCGRPQCPDCIPRRDRQVAIDALRAALGVSNG
jgi:hypothetical protein